MDDRARAQTQGSDRETEAEIDLMELIVHLVGKAGWIAAAAFAGLALMSVYSLYMARPVYEATSKLYVLSQQDSAINLSDLQIGSQLTNDYMQVFNTWEVQEMVLQELGLDYSYRELRDMLTLSNPSNTRILHITASSDDAQEAALIANTFAAAAQYYIAEVMLTDEPRVFSQALVPTEKVAPRHVLNAVIGFASGAVLAAGWFVLRFFLDDKIRTADDVRKYTGLPNLAVVPVNGALTQDKAQGKRAARRKGKRP